MSLENMILTGGYKIQIFDKDGKKIKEIRKCVGDLVLNNLVNIVCSMLQGGQIHFKDIDGNDVAADSIDFTKSTGIADENDDSFGLLIGQGNTPASLSDYKLENQIKNSVMQYSKCSYSVESSSTNAKPTLSRKFTNNGSSNVTINEIGLAVKLEITQSGGNTGQIKVLLMRDVINAISVPPGGIFNLEYYFNFNPNT